MSLIGQIWLKLFVVIVLAFVGGVVVHTDAMRDTLQTQLQLKNADNATALAQVLSQQKGDEALMELALSAQFDTGFYRRIRFVGADGVQRFLREGRPQPLAAPRWFAQWLPIAAAPGVAQVSDGWRALGHIEVESQGSFAHDELWHAVQRGATAMLMLGLLAAAAGALMVGRIRRPLERAVEQAHSLERGEYVTVEEPSTPELRRLVSAMNSMVLRLKQVFEGQATQVETLRRQANCDALTGLSNRAHFMGQLDAALHREDGSAEGGLVLLRILDLAELNRSIGHDSADRMIATIAQALQAYTTRADGCFVGRLNGSDFAICLPVGGVAEETARALCAALQAVLPAFGKQAAVAAGAVETVRATALAALMAQADLALARAEAKGAFAVETAGEPGTTLARLGEGGWRRRLHEALAAGRASLVEYPVRSRSGHSRCTSCHWPAAPTSPQRSTSARSRWRWGRSRSTASRAPSTSRSPRSATVASPRACARSCCRRRVRRAWCGWRFPRPRRPTSSSWCASSHASCARPARASASSMRASASAASSACSNWGSTTSSSTPRSRATSPATRRAPVSSTAWWRCCTACRCR